MAQPKILGDQIDQSTLDANNFLPSQTGNAGEVLTTDGSVVSWQPLPAGVDAARYRISTTVGPTPATGTIRFDNSTQASATTLYLSDTTYGNIDITNYLATLVANNRIVIQSSDNLDQSQIWEIVSVTDSGTYFTVVVTNLEAIGGNFSNDEDVVVGFVKNIGGGGGSGTVTSVDMSVPSFLSVSGNPVTTSGTLAVSLSGTALPAVNGGTGQTGFATGDILYASSSTALSKLAVGSDGQVLTLASGLPSWAAAGGGGGTSYTLQPVRVATTANGTLATAYENGDTIDGVVLATGNRILIKNQSSATENGIYTVNASGAPTRAADFNTGAATLTGGAIVPVIAGTLNTGTQWQCSNATAITIGSTNITFIRSGVKGYITYGSEPTTLPVSSGSNSIAIGNAATTTAGTGSVAIGPTASTASRNDCVAIGNGANASSATNQVAIGASASAGGYGGVAIGNAASSSSSGIAIGSGVSASGSTVGGVGIAGSNTGTSGICIGNSGSNSGTNGIVIGSGTNSLYMGVKIGSANSTEFVAETNFQSQVFSGNNGVKSSLVVIRAQTTNNTATELGNNSTTFNTATINTYIVLANNSAYIFDCDIVARQATTGDTSTWNLKFAIKRGANAAATTLLGSPTATLIAQDAGASAWTVAVTADTTNGRPNISATGEASKTINWVANIRMTKVS